MRLIHMATAKSRQSATVIPSSQIAFCYSPSLGGRHATDQARPASECGGAGAAVSAGAGAGGAKSLADAVAPVPRAASAAGGGGHGLRCQVGGAGGAAVQHRGAHERAQAAAPASRPAAA